MNLFPFIPYHVHTALKTVPGGTPGLQTLNGFDPGIESGCSGTELPQGGTVSSAMESAFWHHPPPAPAGISSGNRIDTSQRKGFPVIFVLNYGVGHSSVASPLRLSTRRSLSLSSPGFLVQGFSPWQ